MVTASPVGSLRDAAARWWGGPQRVGVQWRNGGEERGPHRPRALSFACTRARLRTGCGTSRGRRDRRPSRRTHTRARRAEGSPPGRARRRGCEAPGNGGNRRRASAEKTKIRQQDSDRVEAHAMWKKVKKLGMCVRCHRVLRGAGSDDETPAARRAAPPAAGHLSGPRTPAKTAAFTQRLTLCEHPAASLSCISLCKHRRVCW